MICRRAGSERSNSESAAVPDVGVKECLRCRGCKQRFATASELRIHTSHCHLRNSECAEQKRKDPRLLISSWKPGPAHRSDCTVFEAEHAALVLAGGDFIESILLDDNADEPADAAPSQVTLSLRVNFKLAGQVQTGSLLRVPGPGCNLRQSLCLCRSRPGPRVLCAGPACWQ